jgi:oxygen-independent coproporphyrinogen-3 oxidase
MSSLDSLFRKYNVAGPRYTSYPTVPYWTDSPTESQWIESISQALTEGRRQGAGAALYIHIPFCESLCTYCGCNTRITRNHGVARPYVESLLKEWSLYRSRLGSDIELSEIHLGGGTPTFLSADDLKYLIEGILGPIQVSQKFEFSVEADPRVTSKGQLEVLSQLGFRRLSLGIQDFDPKVQEIVHRIQSKEQVGEITQMARDLGYNSINYDLIYGLPFQTQKSIRDTVEVVRNLKPDRIAFYGYAHVPWIKPSQRRFTEADLPSGDEKRALYELGRKLLEEVGYAEIGMDHFALAQDSLWGAYQEGTLHRNFMGYTSRFVTPLMALGVSAIGDSGQCFAQNEKLVETYQSRVEMGEIPIQRGHMLTSEDQLIRRHILNLMTRMETDWNDPTLQTPHLALALEKLVELQRDGLVELTSHSCRVTPQGRPFMRNVCMAFDARLAEKAPDSQLFSKTI